MEEQQQRRLEIIRTCLNQLKKYFVGSQCATIITEAQVQLDKLLSGDMPPLLEVPITPDGAAEAKRRKRFPQELIMWFNEQLVDAFDEADNRAGVSTTNAPNWDRNKSWLNISALREVYEHTGWCIEQKAGNFFVFSKRDEKQASSIN